MVKVKVKRLLPAAVLPAYAKPNDAGLDVFAVSKKESDRYVEYGTGLAFELPEGHVMLVFPRSSVSDKDLVLANSVGVLDTGYRGELKLRFRKTGSADYNIGDRIGQIIVIPIPVVEFEEVDELSDSVRGNGGFGSTGN